MTNKFEFFYPYTAYNGNFPPQQVLFNANLQKFSQRIVYTSNLAHRGKIPLEVAYAEIEQLWQQLNLSKKKLGIDREECVEL